MRVKFWGVRGSIPVPGLQTLKFGGNTPCVTVELEQEPLIVLDAGTGIRMLGQELAQSGKPCHMVLLLSHGHWDHIQGFPFFSPAYRSDSIIEVRCCPDEPDHLHRMLSDVMEHKHFPVPLESLSANITFLRLCQGWETLGSGRVFAIATTHPGGGHGYRIEERGRSVVYLTDNELVPGSPKWEGFVDAARGADVLIHDSHYTSTELSRFKGWGHSSIEQTVQLAVDAGVGTVYLFHHAPDRTDDELTVLLEEARAMAHTLNPRLDVRAAAEGDEHILTPDPAA